MFRLHHVQSSLPKGKKKGRGSEAIGFQFKCSDKEIVDS